MRDALLQDARKRLEVLHPGPPHRPRPRSDALRSRAIQKPRRAIALSQARQAPEAQDGQTSPPSFLIEHSPGAKGTALVQSDSGNGSRVYTPLRKLGIVGIRSCLGHTHQRSGRRGGIPKRLRRRQSVPSVGAASDRSSTGISRTVCTWSRDSGVSGPARPAGRRGSTHDPGPRASRGLMSAIRPILLPTERRGSSATGRSAVSRSNGPAGFSTTRSVTGWLRPGAVPWRAAPAASAGGGAFMISSVICPRRPGRALPFWTSAAATERFFAWLCFSATRPRAASPIPLRPRPRAVPAVVSTTEGFRARPFPWASSSTSPPAMSSSTSTIPWLSWLVAGSFSVLGGDSGSRPPTSPETGTPSGDETGAGSSLPVISRSSRRRGCGGRASGAGSRACGSSRLRSTPTKCFATVSRCVSVAGSGDPSPRCGEERAVRPAVRLIAPEERSREASP